MFLVVVLEGQRLTHSADPDKPDIPGHVEALFKRHNFEHVARAVKTKYGVLPPVSCCRGAWETEAGN